MSWHGDAANGRDGANGSGQLALPGADEGRWAAVKPVDGDVEGQTWEGIA